MVICMALLAPSHPYLGLPNRRRASGCKGGANSSGDEAEMVATGPNAFKQTV